MYVSICCICVWLCKHVCMHVNIGELVGCLIFFLGGGYVCVFSFLNDCEPLYCIYITRVFAQS